MTMDAPTARLVRAMYETCVGDGVGFEGDWDEQRPLVVEAFTVTGASKHEMWDNHLISDAEHDMATCGHNFCVGSRELDAARGVT